MKKIIETAESRLCSGCGVCVANCPKQCLEMKFNRKGEYYPQINMANIDKCNDCHLCSDSCSFLNEHSSFSDSNLKWNEKTGYYLSSYVGNMIGNEERMRSASGGIATALLSYLLKEKIIDYVIAAKQTQNQHPLIQVTCCSTIEEVRQCSGSFYYPIEYSEALKLIMNQDGKYAIIGLPCMLSSLTLACRKNKKLDKSIKYKIGLTCGSNKSAAYTDYITKKFVSTNPIKSIKFRLKTQNEPASNYKIKIEAEGSSPSILSSKTWGKIWSLGVFDQCACSYCDDVFAEAADITLMDAWLPQYIKDAKGTNLIICRSAEVDKVLHIIENCTIREIDINDIIYSQEKVASPIKDKQTNNIYYSKKYPVLNRKLRFKEKRISMITKFQLYLKRKSQLLYQNQYSLDPTFDIRKFDKKLQPLLRAHETTVLAQRILRKISKILKIY